MTQAVRDIGNRLPIAAFWYRAGLWLIVAALSLQLAASTYQKHKLAAQSGDSVSYYIAAHLPPEPSTSVSRVFAPCSLYFCASGPHAVLFFISHHDYFIPRSQAPPLARHPIDFRLARPA